LNRFLALIVALAALALAVAGCGSSDDSTTDDGTTEATASLTKAEFIKQGNAICKTSNEELDSQFEEFSEENDISENEEPSKELQEEAAETILVPGVSEQLEELRALGTPEDDNGEGDAILTSAEEALEEIEDDPSSAFSEDSGFEEVNKEATAYGLTVCGE
jgi:hypothetical protein